jgi:hypothetical protein
MTWRRVEIDISDEGEGGETSHPSSSLGLDISASESHSQFLAESSHISEVSRGHEGFLNQVGVIPESSKMASNEILPVGELVADLGGSVNGDFMEIPMPSADRRDVVLEVMEGELGSLARIMSPSSFGGVLRTFRLPSGSIISGATWNGHTLGLSLENHS